MEINEIDLGKIVQLPVKPEWGLGIISKVENRFAFILFRSTEEKIAKKYYRVENPLKLAADQVQPDLTKRARAKNKKVKALVVRPTE
ncbi:MAG TPA: hypothetical protein VK859_07855 [bacterium]|jgi:hypothetical protein|nr:hypothetical protein [bacterium]